MNGFIIDAVFFRSRHFILPWWLCDVWLLSLV